MVKQKRTAAQPLQACQHVGHAHGYLGRGVFGRHPPFYFSGQSRMSRFFVFSELALRLELGVSAPE